MFSPTMARKSLIDGLVWQFYNLGATLTRQNYLLNATKGKLMLLFMWILEFNEQGDVSNVLPF